MSRCSLSQMRRKTECRHSSPHNRTPRARLRRKIQCRGPVELRQLSGGKVMESEVVIEDVSIVANIANHATVRPCLNEAMVPQLSVRRVEIIDVSNVIIIERIDVVDAALLVRNGGLLRPRMLAGTVKQCGNGYTVCQLHKRRSLAITVPFESCRYTAAWINSEIRGWTHPCAFSNSSIAKSAASLPMLFVPIPAASRAASICSLVQSPISNIISESCGVPTSSQGSMVSAC